MAYEKTLWKTGDVVTEEKMNKIEQGIKSVELPSVTATDNGKVLTVVDGEWAPGDGGSSNGSSRNTLMITITEILPQTYDDPTIYTTDTKWSELRYAIEHNMDVVCVKYLPYSYSEGTYPFYYRFLQIMAEASYDWQDPNPIVGFDSNWIIFEHVYNWFSEDDGKYNGHHDVRSFSLKKNLETDDDIIIEPYDFFGS